MVLRQYCCAPHTKRVTYTNRSNDVVCIPCSRRSPQIKNRRGNVAECFGVRRYTHIPNASQDCFGNAFGDGSMPLPDPTRPDPNINTKPRTQPDPTLVADPRPKEASRGSAASWRACREKNSANDQLRQTRGLLMFENIPPVVLCMFVDLAIGRPRPRAKLRLNAFTSVEWFFHSLLALRMTSLALVQVRH